MTRIVFQDFDEFADAINGVAGRFVPTGRSQGDWWVQVEPVGQLAIQQIQIGGASMFAGDGRDRAITIGIPGTAPERIRIDGDWLSARSFIAVRAGQPFTFSARQTVRWVGVTIPVHGLLAPEVVETLYRREASNVRGGTHARADPTYVAYLRSAVTRVCASHNPADLSEAALRELEEEIVVLASHMLQASTRMQGGQSVGRPRHDRNRVIGRVLELLEASQGKPLLLRDLSETTGVCERTLRSAFHEYFGVSPMRLLKLRQLHEVHRVLLSAEPRHERVRDVLRGFGVSDLSLFARNYKALYNELPSETLQRTPVSSKRGATPTETWLRYASRRFEYHSYQRPHFASILSR